MSYSYVSLAFSTVADTYQRFHECFPNVWIYELRENLYSPSLSHWSCPCLKMVKFSLTLGPFIPFPNAASLPSVLIKSRPDLCCLWSEPGRRLLHQWFVYRWVLEHWTGREGQYKEWIKSYSPSHLIRRPFTLAEHSFLLLLIWKSHKCYKNTWQVSCLCLPPAGQQSPDDDGEEQAAWF